MKSCDDYQVELEMRRHGVCTPESAVEAEAHLRGCSACQVAERLATQTNENLQRRATTVSQSTDWSGIGKRVGRDLQIYRALPWLMLGSSVVQAYPLGLILAPEAPIALALKISATGIVLALAVALYSRAQIRAALEASSLGREELLSWRRREVQKQISEARWICVGGPFVTAALLAIVAAGWNTPTGWGRFFVIHAVLTAALTAFYMVRALPKLARERSELT